VNSTVKLVVLIEVTLDGPLGFVGEPVDIWWQVGVGLPSLDSGKFARLGFLRHRTYSKIYK